MIPESPFNKIAFDEFLLNGWLVSEGPDHLIVGWGAWQEGTNPNSEIASVYAPDFYLKTARPWRMTQQWSIVTRELFASLVLAKLGSKVNADAQGFQWVEPSFSDFKSQFESIQEGRRSRGLIKAVPIVHAQAREIMSQERLLRILNKLASLPSSLFAYGFWEGGAANGDVRAGLIGATPEILFIENEGLVSTVALAGTRGKTPEGGDAEKLLADPKERREHQLVIDDIMAVLSKHSDVLVSETFAQELPTLFHLKAEIRAEFDEPVSFATMAQELHPTPALGVSPRKLGFDEIARWDDVTLRG
ncbi:MAG TPA: chorismate-binding protein, partial [Bdellovibrionales bacterium]|nr:chorismate-binding protein [Bdellovibrionales bacterium]